MSKITRQIRYIWCLEGDTKDGIPYDIAIIRIVKEFKNPKPGFYFVKKDLNGKLRRLGKAPEGRALYASFYDALLRAPTIAGADLYPKEEGTC